MAGTEARRLVPLNDAAAMLGMSRRTLERRIAAGEIAVFRDRRIVAIPSMEITRYVAERVARRGSARRGRQAAAPSLAPGERLWD
jgi:predicted DNA-binding transcriptional regulator AlpA